MEFRIALAGYELIVTYILSALVGLAVGSFLNVVIYRVPLGMSVATPASHCPNCNASLKWYDNIPVVSYCILGGKCRSCKTHIPFRYTIVELANMLLWIVCVARFSGNVIYGGVVALALSACICVFFIDLEHMLIPDRFQILLAVLGVAAIFLDTDARWWDHLIGAAVGGLVFAGVAFLVGRATGKEALGGGDIKFAAAAGLFLGWQKLMLMALLASVVGSIVMVFLKRKKEDLGEIPFGPFLTSGFAISALFGASIIRWYLSLFA